MPSLNLDIDYFDHPKTKRLVGLLGRGSEVLPLKLWVYCGKFHTRDGRLTGYAAQEIESLVGWWGKPGRFVNAMLTVGFLHQEEDGYVVHEWNEHEGHLFSFAIRGKKAARARWDKAKDECNKHATSNARDGPEQCSYITNIANNSLSAGAGAREGLPTLEGPPAPGEELRKSAYQAFDAWSSLVPPNGRGHPLNQLANEHRAIADLIEQMAQLSPIPRPREVIPRQMMVPKAAECCMNSGAEFRSVKYACGCVRNLLDKWSIEGLPANGSMQNRGSKNGNAKHRPSLSEQLAAKGEFQQTFGSLPEAE